MSQEVNFQRVSLKKYKKCLEKFDDLKLSVVNGPRTMANMKLNSASNQSLNSLYNIILPGTMTSAISSYLVEETKLKFSVTFTNSLGADIVIVNPAGGFSINSAGLNSATATLNTQIGNQSINIQPALLTPVLTSYVNLLDLHKSLQLPATSDEYVDFNFASTASPNGLSECLDSPFNNFASATPLQVSPYCSVIIESITGNNANLTIATGASSTVEIVFTIRGPLFNGFFSMNKKDEFMIPGVSQIQINKNMLSNAISRLIRFQLPQATTATASNASFYSATFKLEPVAIPILYYQVYTFDNKIAPKEVHYKFLDYNSVNVQSVKNNSTPNAVEQGTSQNINFSNVPSCIYLYVADNVVSSNQLNQTVSSPSTPAGTTTSPATYVENSSVPGTQFTNLTINYGNNQIVQQLVTDRQIYDALMAPYSTIPYYKTGKNTIVGTNVFQQVGRVGHVLRIDVSELQLNWSELANSCPASLPFQITYALNNLSSSRASRDLVLTIVPVYERYMSISENVVNSTYSYLTPQIINKLDSELDTIFINPEHMLGGRMLAGAWYNNWNDFVDGASNLASKAWDSAKDIGRFAWDNKDAIAKALPLLGLGKKSHKKGGEMSESDDDLEGGKLIKKKELKKKLKLIDL